METKQALKMESLMGGGASNYHYLTENHSLSSSLSPSTSFISSSFGLDSQMLERINGSSGFMELLGMQDMINITPPLFDMTINGYDYDGSNIINNHNLNNDEAFPSSLQSPALDPTQSTPVSSNVNPESSEVLNNLPTTPNSSSISSASNDDLQQNIHSSDEHEEEQQQKSKKQWTKTKKTSQTRQREPRVAFMTKSEVDHLEDGYRWRKYGQKAVKNSPFPRSYYRCTSASCNVKKRVERSFSDPSIVVTTYEGQHTHPCTVLPRGMMPVAGFGTGIGATTSAYALPMQMSNNMNLSHQLQMNMSYVNSLVPELSYFGNMSSLSSSTISSPLLGAQERRICGATLVNAGLLRDNGLLQDIVPSIMKKEDS